MESKDELNSFLEGLRDSIPLVISFIFVFFAIGQLQNKAGLDVFQSLVLTLLIFASPAQLVIAKMIPQGEWFPALIAVCVINFRFFLMSALLLPYFQKQSKLLILTALFTLSGSTFTVAFIKIKEGEEHPFAYFLGVSCSSFLTAAVATIAGFFMTQSLPEEIEMLLSMVIPIHFTMLIAKSSEKIGFVLAAVIGFLLTPLVVPYLEKWSLLFVGVLTGAVMIGFSRNLISLKFRRVE